MTKRTIRCAIYTRKSTEEGLDQAFNSLDAQREACHAYVLSQAGEGWAALPDCYDDGGFSGGTIERPALQRLLIDIEQGLVDVVVVYKIDRLTRALADFAKIVERFEKRNVSFVSVTQAFNTTSSMGRLTLNVLLSFAQFEREVTAERIRDKFSASRKKGIFMGGCPPLGYDPKARKLVINEPESITVRFIFTRYLELGSVSKLRTELDTKGITTKSWVSTRGKTMGGGRWYIGPLRHILRNRVYVGEAVHKGAAYPGEHTPIVPHELFEQVQTKLDRNRTAYERKRTVGSSALLTGFIFDERGNTMSPSTSRKPDGRTYLYYVSQARLQGQEPDAMRPVPAAAVGEIVCDRLRCAPTSGNPAGSSNGRLQSASSLASGADAFPELVRQLVTRVEVGVGRIAITFNTQRLALHTGVLPKKLAQALRGHFSPDDRIEEKGEHLVLTVPVRLRLRGGIKRVEGWDQADWATPSDRHDPLLIKALCRAHQWREWIEDGEIATLEELATRVHHDRKYVHQILKLAFLAPDVQRTILTGRQPKALSLRVLADMDLPLRWSEQRTLLSFGAS